MSRPVHELTDGQTARTHDVPHLGPSTVWFSPGPGHGPLPEIDESLYGDDAQLLPETEVLDDDPHGCEGVYGDWRDYDDESYGWDER